MLNVAVLTGRLVADPELRHTPNDTAVTSFTIAVNRRFSRNTEERQTDFIDIVAWRTTAEFVCKYFKKGQLISIEGSIQTRSYQDKEGNKRKAFEVIANNVHFVESKKDISNDASDFVGKSDENLSGYSNGSDSYFETIESDDDLPF